MAYDSVTVDISRCKNEKDVDRALKLLLRRNYDVKAMTKDFVILTRQTAK